MLTLLVMKQFEVPPALGTAQLGRLSLSAWFVVAMSDRRWFRAKVLLCRSLSKLLLVSVMRSFATRGCTGLQVQSWVLEVPYVVTLFR